MEWNKTICGDNLIVMQDFIDQGCKFDLCLTDPPYGLSKDFGNDSDNPYKLRDFLRPRVSLLEKLIATNGSCLWFCSQQHIYQVISTFDSESTLWYKRMMMWHYRNGMSRQETSPITEFEPFLWYTQNQKEWTYNRDDVRVPYKSDRVKSPVYKKNKNGEVKAWNPDPRGAKRGDIWEFPCLAGKVYENERTAHLTQKPENLITELIKAFCPKGVDGKYDGSIFDPFHGSGTLGVCCESLNLQGHRIKWIGIELEKRWIDEGDRRVAEVRAKADNYIL